MRDLVPWKRIKPGRPPALESRTLIHWITRGVPVHVFFHLNILHMLIFKNLYWTILQISTYTQTRIELTESESESHSVVSNSLQPQELYSPWNSPGQNTGMDSLSLLQGIFSTQGSNPGLPHCRWILYSGKYYLGNQWEKHVQWLLFTNNVLLLLLRNCLH